MTEQFPKEFGRYKLVQRLAVGGMAELFLAEVEGAHGFTKTVVIKRILPHLGADPQFTTMFIEEAKLTARLVHPKIAQTYELGRHEDQLFIAMEFVDGLDTLAMLRECAHRQLRMPIDIVVHIVHEVLDALDFAHQQEDDAGEPLGIVHRDISPSNVLVSRRGDVKLVDFGIAQALHGERRTKTGTLKGKYGYMSPEQILGGSIEARSDVFSTGVILAEMLMGRRLFAAANELDVLLMVRDVDLRRLERHGVDIDPDLSALLHRALQKRPEDRFESAAEFREALGEWLFDQRFRVSPKRVSDFVGTLYDDACARRRAALADKISEAAGDAPAQAPDTADGSLPGGLVNGIPTGNSSEQPFPQQPSAPEIEIGAHEVNAAAPEPAAEDDAIEVEEMELDLEAGDLELGEQPHAADDDVPILIEEQVSGAIRALASGQAVPGEVREPEHSVRFSSIEAAVSSVSLAEPDPAARDFDGSDIGEGSSGRRAASEADIDTAVEEEPRQRAPELQSIEVEPDESGEFPDTTPIAFLYRMAVARATGLLVTEVGAIRKDTYIRDGHPEFVSSNVASELLGNYLVSQQVLSSGELDMALAMMPHYGGKLGDTLVGLGLMKPLDVFRHLSRQVRDKLVDVCTWQRGAYAWYAGYENPRDAFPLDLDTLQVLGAGAMAMPEGAILEWAERVAHDTPRSGRNGAVNPDQFQVAWVRGVYDSLDGHRTVWELAGRYTSDADRLDFLRVLHLLVECELAQM